MQQQDRTFSSSLGRARALVVLAVAGLALLAAAGGAEAKVHTYRAFGGKRSAVKKFRVLGLEPRTIVGARLVTRRGGTKVPLSIVRRAARSRRHILRVVVLPRGSRAGKRTGRTRARERRRAARASARGHTRLVRVPSKAGAKALKVTTTPETTIVDGPVEGSQTASTSAQFSFKSSSPAKTEFYCSLDGSPPSRCKSRLVHSSLSVGSHRFTVYAVDRYGNRDLTPAERSWSVVSTTQAETPAEATGEEPIDTESTDTAAPDTRITAGPAEGSSSTSTSASFSFRGEDNVGVVGFECALDGASFSPCSSPKAYSGLSQGMHTFRVRAGDAAGNVDPTPPSRSWTVGASTSVYTIPTSVDDSCQADDTGPILSWLGSVPDGSTVAFAQGACYRIEGTLTLKDRALTIEGNGATFRSLDPPDDQRAVWRVWDSDVAMRDMTIAGSYAGGGTLDTGVEHAHGVDLRGTHAVVENVAMSDLGGDCVYFGLGATRSSGAVRDSSCRRIGRNAVSITAGDDIRVERVVTDQIGYIAFDVEPNAGSGFGSSHAVFDSNTIGSYYMKAYTVIGNAPISDQEFTNNRVQGQGLKIGVVNRAYNPEALRIAGNSSDTATTPAAMNLDGIRGVTVTGNSVPMTTGTMAAIDSSCGIQVNGNSYPGGTKEYAITNSTTSC